MSAGDFRIAFVLFFCKTFVSVFQSGILGNFEIITALVFPPERQCKCWWPLLGLFLRNDRDDDHENYDAID